MDVEIDVDIDVDIDVGLDVDFALCVRVLLVMKWVECISFCEAETVVVYDDVGARFAF